MVSVCDESCLGEFGLRESDVKKVQRIDVGELNEDGEIEISPVISRVDPKIIEQAKTGLKDLNGRVVSAGIYNIVGQKDAEKVISDVYKVVDNLMIENLSLKNRNKQLELENSVMKEENEFYEGERSKWELQVKIMKYLEHEYKNTGTAIKGYSDLLQYDVDGVEKNISDEIRERCSDLIYAWENVKHNIAQYRKASSLFFELLVKGERCLDAKEQNGISCFKDCIEEPLAVLHLVYSSEKELFYKEKSNLHCKIETNGLEEVKLKISKLIFTVILVNLLKNSVEALEDRCNTLERKILLKADLEADFFKITIRDNGCGMTQEEINKIIERCGHSTKSRLGSGVGLESCMFLLKKSGGSLNIFSEGKNKGSEFVVRIPLCRE